jgi:hypothetical protein
MQILTVEELLSGKTVDYPHSEGVNVTFNKAPKAKGKKMEHPELNYPAEYVPAACLREHILRNNYDIKA